MNAKQQLIACYTIIYRELERMLRISSQVFIPPMISTLLYFLIFGQIIGQRIGNVYGQSYSTFIAPGLIMMAVITNSYANVSTSLFSVRFQKSIEEQIVSPMHYSLILLGYTAAGVVRGVLVGCIVYFVASFFAELDFSQLLLTFLIIIIVAALFSLAGFCNGILARTFDDVAFIPTFIISPLTYLGGVFYAITMLSPFWQTISYFNPIYYMVNALRQVMIGTHGFDMAFAITIICLFLGFLTALNIWMLKKGIGLRD